MTELDDAPEPIAIISMAGRFPGADSVDQFWANLCAEVDSIDRFSPADLLLRDHDPEHALHPRFVGAEGRLDDPELFAAEFFGYPPHQAEIMDPQHRICLELAWEAIDAVGYDPATLDAPTGVFVATAFSTYLVRNLLGQDPGRHREAQRRDGLNLLLHNDKDFVPSTISYRLGLTGPSYAIGSACSSSLVAVHVAARSLWAQECDLALAGGVCVHVPQQYGYLNDENGIYSPDGRCAAFDVAANGTVGGSGAGMVLLKRLADAQRDGDHVVALLLGSAVNNDGGDKVGYTAPGVRGQRDAIIEAHAVAGVSADSIGLVEAHGTGTRLGDPVEVEALTQAFQVGTARQGYCALGSVKSNIGHLDAAAGIAGLVKAAMSVRTGVIPASLHVEEPNAALGLPRTPFFVPPTTVGWPVSDQPRRAGVSSFGMGGTNAHVVLEEPPVPVPRDRRLRAGQVLTLSATDTDTLTATARDLADHLREHPDSDLADVAGTLAGRRALPYRRAVLAADLAGAVAALSAPSDTVAPATARQVILLLGDLSMTPDLESVAAVEVTPHEYWQECVAAFAAAGFDLPGAAEGHAARRYAHGYAYGRTLRAWGVRPTATVAAGPELLAAQTLTGALTTAEAVRLVLRDDGTVATDPGRLAREVGGHLNGQPSVVVVLGDSELVDALRRECSDEQSIVDMIGAGPADDRPTMPLTGALARLWVTGVDVDWAELHRAQRTRRVPVPSRRLQRRRYWVDPPARPVPFADLVELGGPLRREVARQRGEPPGIDDYPGLREDLDRFCAQLALWSLRRVGLDVRAGTTHDAAELPRRLGVLPALRRLLDAMLTMLLADGYVVRDGDRLRFTSLLDGTATGDEEVVAAGRKLTLDHPEFAGLVHLLLHCARGYPRALREPGEARRLLCPEGDSDLPERGLSRYTVAHRAAPGLAATLGTLLDDLVSRLDRPVRVLEVGAGLGGLTSVLAAGHGAGKLIYHATDISRASVSRLATLARERGWDWVRADVLDITADPAAQGFGGHRYDLICGLDVLHAVPDLRECIAGLRSVLAPGGLLALIETTATDRWTTLVWGLSPGRSEYGDACHHNPLLSADNWRALLGESGFDGYEVLVPTHGPRDAALLLAQEPGRLAGTPRAPSAPAWPAKRADLATWSYVPGWRHGPSVAPAASGTDGICLLFSGVPGNADVELGALVRERLAARGLRVVTVAAGPTPEASHTTLMRRLAEADGPVRLVVHLWAAEDSWSRRGPVTAEALPDSQRFGLHSLLDLARALDTVATGDPVRLIAVTVGTQAVLGDEVRHPEHATVAAAAKVIPREYPWLSCTAMDIDDVSVLPYLADRVVDELMAADESTIVGYRGRRRFVPQYLAEPLGPATTPVVAPRTGGVYLVCGGLGGLGLSIAEWLGTASSSVVLTSRRDFPAAHTWDTYDSGDNATARAVRRLRVLRAAGARVEVVRADVTDAARMRAVITAAEDRYGPLTGVVHAAGVTDTAGMIQRRSAADTDAVIRAKTIGPLVLDEALGERRLDFFVLCSSIGTVLYKIKFGEIGYLAGNEFVDAFAEYRRSRGRTETVAVNWSDWLDDGMGADAQRRLGERYHTNGPSPTDDLLGGLSHAEGVEMLARIVGHGVGPRVVVSTQDLDEMLARHASFSTADHLAAVSGLRAVAPTPPARPASADTLTDPAERTLAGFFTDLLGVPQIAPTDDFFELGGDSLIALRLLAMLRDEYGVELSMGVVFDTPTVRGLARAVDRARTTADGEKEAS
ncbi:SDR family NAD(P)-dependent oxidoreductase [Micromonospora lutea]|uniref:Uncharacterized protein n=1 Tax=Micromonospora lutea TaxID=419825 RepID=A0ABQ4IT22_9ACTN|nr:SDR family NAD(P)-dependent oxidoreductase [Micromonospora lutea]GIJ21056.1 hypothetical protein Vlu01_16800 [Micromonospora lutea]